MSGAGELGKRTGGRPEAEAELVRERAGGSEARRTLISSSSSTSVACGGTGDRPDAP
jgi:hypothetical protein